MVTNEHDQSALFQTGSSPRVVDLNELPTNYQWEELKVYAWADPKLADFIVLQDDFCQAKIDGRQDSTACPVIAMLHASKILNRRALTTASFNPNVISEFIRSMRQGNTLYDQGVPDRKLLTLPQALQLLSSPLTICDRCRCTCSSTNELIEKFSVWMLKALAEQRTIAAGLIQSEMCILVVFFPDGSGMVFDSHSHDRFGAELVKLPKYDATKAVEVCESLIGKITSAHLTFVFER